MMTKQPKMTPDAIRVLAVKFRKLMDDLDRSKWGVLFTNFPRGSCGAASEMFGTYLFEECSVNAKYVSANHSDDFGSHGSHAWIELGDLIVDLTCDQFPHNPLPAPYVGKNRTWHSQWAVQDEPYMDVLLEINRARMFDAWRTAYWDLVKHLEHQ